MNEAANVYCQGVGVGRAFLRGRADGVPSIKLPALVWGGQYRWGAHITMATQ